jgi:hypothetical protein
MKTCPSIRQQYLGCRTAISVSCRCVASPERCQPHAGRHADSCRPTRYGRVRLPSVVVSSTEINSCIDPYCSIERALYSCQQSFHPLFSITRAECRLEYRIQENRSLFISLLKNIIYIGERGCARTALEFSKVLLRLRLSSIVYRHSNTFDMF